MTITVVGTITGAAQTGLTSPTYTTVQDFAPDANSKQAAVTTLGGTQAGVTTNAPSDPFTVTVKRPRQYKGLSVNAATGKVLSAPKNKIEILVRKGVLVLASNPKEVADVRITMNIPAGADLADAINIRAMLSLAFGLANSQSSAIGDTAITGITGAN